MRHRPSSLHGSSPFAEWSRTCTHRWSFTGMLLRPPAEIPWQLRRRRAHDERHRPASRLGSVTQCRLQALELQRLSANEPFKSGDLRLVRLDKFGDSGPPAKSPGQILLRDRALDPDVV